MNVLRVSYPVSFSRLAPNRRHACSRRLQVHTAFARFPRILEELPIRRFHIRGDHAAAFDLSNKELSRILSPTSGTTPELLTGTSLLFALITIAVALEFLQRSFQSVNAGSLPGNYSDTAAKSQRHADQIRNTAAAQQEKLLRRQLIQHEKFRGLRWLAIATALVVWSTGILNKDNPLQP
ncbi:hypothetical protein ABBQ38_014035 [Trebouxia sp. C0009 RCD-2024]